MGVTKRGGWMDGWKEDRRINGWKDGGWLFYDKEVINTIRLDGTKKNDGGMEG